MFEGAQGTMLDIDHGTYPFVTSSSATSGGAVTGTGVPPTSITTVIGVTKAYCTRVGGGPFPTELHDEMGEAIRKKGNEFGAVTGRPRRTGWIDLPLLRYSNMINGTSWLVVTKLDVLDDLAEIPVCVGYKIDGKATEEIPAQAASFDKIEPIYTKMPGWNTSTFGIEQLRSACRRRRRSIWLSWRKRRARRSASFRPGRIASRRRLRLSLRRCSTTSAGRNRGLHVVVLAVVWVASRATKTKWPTSFASSKPIAPRAGMPDVHRASAARTIPRASSSTSSTRRRRTASAPRFAALSGIRGEGLADIADRVRGSCTRR